MMHLHGTLILYDSENMKVPALQAGEYKVSRISIEKLTDSIKSVFKDTHHHFVSFGKRYYGKKNEKNERIDRYNRRLYSLGYTIIEKMARIKSNTVLVDDKLVTYEYEDCDMDGDIIHMIHTMGKDYSRVILISGDGDMKPSLDYIKENYKTEVWIVSHPENLSRVYKNDNVMDIAELLTEKRREG
jgi:hypothetical protein